MSEDRGVTQSEVVDAVSEGMRSGISALAAALRSGQATASAPVTVRTGRSQSHPLTVAGIAVALAVPLGGWVMSLSNRVAVLEAQTSTLQTASVEIAALKQEVSDFRKEFEDALGRGHSDDEFRRELNAPSEATK